MPHSFPTRRYSDLEGYLFGRDRWRPAIATNDDRRFWKYKLGDRRVAARHGLAGRLRGPREAFPRRGQRGPAASEGRGRPAGALPRVHRRCRSEEHTSELQSLMRISYAVFCLKKKKNTKITQIINTQKHRN